MHCYIYRIMSVNWGEMIHAILIVNFMKIVYELLY